VLLRHKYLFRSVAQRFAESRLGYLERLMYFLSFLKLAQHLFVVVVVPLSLIGDDYLHRRSLSVLRNLGERGERHIHRVVLEHVRGFERKCGVVAERRVRARMFARIVEYIVVAATFGDARVRKDRRDEPLREQLFTSRDRKIECRGFCALRNRYFERESFAMTDHRREARVELLRRPEELFKLHLSRLLFRPLPMRLRMHFEEHEVECVFYLLGERQPFLRQTFRHVADERAVEVVF
jgi:hypothetical protein